MTKLQVWWLMLGFIFGNGFGTGELTFEVCMWYTLWGCRRCTICGWWSEEDKKKSGMGGCICE